MGCDEAEFEEIIGCDSTLAEEILEQLTGTRGTLLVATEKGGCDGVITEEIQTDSRTSLLLRSCDGAETEEVLDNLLGQACDTLVTLVESKNASNSRQSVSIISRGCDGAETEETITGCTG